MSSITNMVSFLRLCRDSASGGRLRPVGATAGLAFGVINERRRGLPRRSSRFGVSASERRRTRSAFALRASARQPSRASSRSSGEHAERRVAEGEGFEPPGPFRVQRFSRPPPSTTRPSLRSGESLPGNQCEDIAVYVRCADFRLITIARLSRRDDFPCVEARGNHLSRPPSSVSPTGARSSARTRPHSISQSDLIPHQGVEERVGRVARTSESEEEIVAPQCGGATHERTQKMK